MLYFTQASLPTPPSPVPIRQLSHAGVTSHFTESHTMETYLGLDGGGTKTAALVVDGDGRILGEGAGGPGNVAHNPGSVLRKSLQDACSSAAAASELRDSHTYTSVCAGIAGYSVEEKRDEFEAILRREVSALQYRIEPDYLVAYWGATHGDPGIVVVAGTGAVAFGRNESGVSHRSDGLGYLLGDRGSGFDLGLYALRYALHKMEDGQTDDLSSAVIAHTGATRQTEIVQWLYGNFNPARVASLSPIVGALAESGDIAARNLASEMARRLRHTVRDVRHKLWLPRETPVYPLGKLWLLGNFFRSEFAEPTWPGGNGVVMTPEPTSGGTFNLVEPKNDAAYGAALLARFDAAAEHK